MTVLHCHPLIFHDTKILTVFGINVFDLTQWFVADWLSAYRFAFEASEATCGFDESCDTAH
jgi:hypothetical protein